MLRIAVPNKGSLSEAACAMLHEAGYRQRKDRELLVADPASGAELFFLRPRDIATYVGSGRLDIGITGRDLLLDSGAAAEEIMQLGFARSTFRFAGRPGTGSTVEDLAGMRIASSYTGVVQAHLAAAGVKAEVVKLDGAVEIAIELGVADVIADVVETGTTLRQMGLELIGAPILQSEAVLVRRTGAEPDPAVDQFVRRMQGVLVARRYVLMDYDIRAERLKEAVAVTPGLESPTISPLHTEGWVAVRSMVLRDDAQRIMDDLWGLGARAILVTDIRACRL
ncbi:MAG TPA: ATP phosphoribosyltransferase [Actinocrinis sp.]|jgi:ATP phosphoribosyltransferase|uniref:ATP phosphoribosyltransferase n=1 Tax=Actinocrinis sp. TaxID=1920516 RepID=UPI002D2CE0A2|nr:ATP phosphoribosyltransferase [Actinocrinis sp.]HZU59104.1 ATP phosphoribosyltransferase [Actinocrinis sp.]